MKAGPFKAKQYGNKSNFELKCKVNNFIDFDNVDFRKFAALEEIYLLVNINYV